MEKSAGRQLEATLTFDPTKFPDYKHRPTIGTSGSLQEVPDKKGSTVYIFHRVMEEGGKATVPFGGKFLRIYVPAKLS